MIIVRRRRAIAAGTVAGRGATQAGLAAVLIIERRLAPVFKRGQTALDVIEFRCGYGVFRPRGQDFLNLFLGLRDSIGRLRMRGESLGQGSWLLLFQRLQLLEE